MMEMLVSVAGHGFNEETASAIVLQEEPAFPLHATFWFLLYYCNVSGYAQLFVKGHAENGS